MTDPTKIVRLTAENFKRLTAVEITPDGSVVRIRGRNAQGKSSVLDAIEAVLGGKRSSPTRPVRNGAKKSRIVAELDGLTVTRTFAEDGGGSLVVESSDGARYKSPQAILDKLVGNLSLDPLAFCRAAPQAQLETLRGVVGVDMSGIEAKRAESYAERTQVNRDAKRLDAEIQGMGALEHVEPVDVDALIQEHADVLEAREEHGRWQDAVKNAEAARAAADAHIVRLEDSIEDLRSEARARRSALGPASDAITVLRRRADGPVPDVDAARVRLASATRTNEKAAQCTRRAELEADLARKTEAVKHLTQGIAELDERKREAIAAADLPVKGLAWDDDGVTLDGIPFAQASSAEKLRASVGIALAQNPTLRVLLVREGSLLDDDGLALLAEMATAAGAQVWIEQVGTGGVGIVIEDGTTVEIATEKANA